MYVVVTQILRKLAYFFEEGKKYIIMEEKYGRYGIVSLEKIT